MLLRRLIMLALGFNSVDLLVLMSGNHFAFSVVCLIPVWLWFGICVYAGLVWGLMFVGVDFGC